MIDWCADAKEGSDVEAATSEADVKGKPLRELSIRSVTSGAYNKKVLVTVSCDTTAFRHAYLLSNCAHMLLFTLQHTP